MAIYHLTAKIVSRAKGQSVVASAAYRAGEALDDARYGVTHDYTRKHGIAHAEILAPDGAPAWVHDRQELWNRVEAAERRKDAQLAREIEIGLPKELTHRESVALVREFIAQEFVSQGMIADFAIHRDDENNPHVHILLTLRRATAQGFGYKERGWNAKANLVHWRGAWAEHANVHLARAGLDIRIDHRTLEAQQIELVPGRKIGVGRERQGETTLPRHVSERVAESERIAHANGELILADPAVALQAITRQRSTFTQQDIARFLHTRTHGADQFDAAFLKVTTSNELVALGTDDARRMRYTTQGMLAAEKSLLSRAAVLRGRRGHGVSAATQAAVLAPSNLSAEQRRAFEHVTGEGDAKAIVGVAGSGKSTLLAAAREAWEAQGLTVKGAALSGIAAENLEVASGIRSRTLASYEYAWKEGRDPLTARDVLVIDEAGMIGTLQLERMLAAADRARAKVVLVGDPEQLQAIEAGAAFRGVIGEIGTTELAQVRRQRDGWAREATQALAGGNTPDALIAYEAHGAIHAAGTRAGARTALLADWSREAAGSPGESRLILAYTREDVRQLNDEARQMRKARQELKAGELLTTTRGAREFAVSDRIVFLRNEKSLGVKNGSLGTIEAIERGVLQVRLDGHDEARVSVETRDYQDLDHGYALTVHKAQGSTVERTYVLASRYFDRHTSYVALSRHRQSARLYYGLEEFAAGTQNGAIDAAAARDRLFSTLSRARPQELAHDYLDRALGEESGRRLLSAPAQEHDTPAPSLTPEELQARARERWLEFRARQGSEKEGGRGLDQSPEAGRAQDRPEGPALPDDDLAR